MFKSRHCHLLAVWPGAMHLASLCLRLLICRKAAPTTQGFWEIKWISANNVPLMMPRHISAFTITSKGSLRLHRGGPSCPPAALPEFMFQISPGPSPHLHLPTDL